MEKPAGTEKSIEFSPNQVILVDMALQYFLEEDS